MDLIYIKTFPVLVIKTQLKPTSAKKRNLLDHKIEKSKGSSAFGPGVSIWVQSGERNHGIT